MVLSLCFSGTSRGTPSKCPHAPSYLDVPLNPREGLSPNQEEPRGSLCAPAERPSRGCGSETCSSHGPLPRACCCGLCCFVLSLLKVKALIPYVCTFLYRLYAVLILSSSRLKKEAEVIDMMLQKRHQESGGRSDVSESPLPSSVAKSRDSEVGGPVCSAPVSYLACLRSSFLICEVKRKMRASGAGGGPNERIPRTC